MSTYVNTVVYNLKARCIDETLKYNAYTKELIVHSN